MSNGAQDWFSQNAPKKDSGGDWFSANSPGGREAEAVAQRPDAAMQASKAVTSNIKPLIPGTGTVDPTGGFAEAQKSPKYQGYMKGSGEFAGSTAGMMATAPLKAGLKGLPGWQTPAIYKIEGNKVTFERVLTSGDETQAWSGVKGQSGQIMLVGEGGNKSDQWVMEFSGKWAGENKTKLTGRFINTSGSTGYRICTINLR